MEIDLILVLLLVLLGRSLGSLLNRFDIQSLLGEVLAGVIIGALIIFGVLFFAPENEATLKAFSDLGILLLMLISGLTTDFRSFAKNKGSSILVGALGVIVSFVVVFFPVYFLGTLYLGLTTEAALLSSLFLAAILSNTAIEVCAKLFLDKPGKGRIQAVALGASFVDDIIAVFLIGVVSSIVLLDSTPTMWEIAFLALKVLVFLSISFLLMTKVVDWVFDKLLTKWKEQEKMMLTATILLAFFFALAARPFGLHEVIGAYMAGLIIGKWGSRLDPLLKHRLAWKKLVDDIDPPLRAIFGPLFFGFIGLSFVIGLFVNNGAGPFDIGLVGNVHIVEIIVLVLILTFMAFAGKIIGCGIGAKLSKFSAKGSMVIGAAMCGRGALELVLLSYGRDLAIITDDQFSAVVIVTLITILATPILYCYTEKKRAATEDTK